MKTIDYMLIPEYIMKTIDYMLIGRARHIYIFFRLSFLSRRFNDLKRTTVTFQNNVTLPLHFKITLHYRYISK